MDAMANVLNSGITETNLAGTVPNVGTMFVALIIFSIGLMIFRRILRGARKGSPRV